MQKSLVNVHILVFVLVLLTGSLSYCALGNQLSEIVIYDLPEGVPYTVITQIFYMLNIMGTFIMMAMPMY